MIKRIADWCDEQIGLMLPIALFVLGVVVLSGLVTFIVAGAFAFLRYVLS